MTLALAFGSVRVPPGHAATLALFVSPTGSDRNSGQSATRPLKNVQLALDRAAAGTTVNLAPGAYVGDLATSTAGAAAARITIRGTDNARGSTAHRTVVYGTDHVINIDHSYYTLTGFAVDGQQDLEAAYRRDHAGSRTGFPDAAALAVDPKLMTAFKDTYQPWVHDGRLVYVGTTATDVTGVVVTTCCCRAVAVSALRLRSSTTRSTIRNSVIRYCGLFAQPSGDRYAYHNAEGIYVGTSPKSTTQPQAGRDASDHNTISGNIVWTFGAECVDVKEVAAFNTVSGNDCGFNLEPGFDFVKGGKLPGLYGGRVTSGRHIPDGANGFSTRYMWRRLGAGEVYAYLPTSVEHGTSLGRDSWRWPTGVWTHVQQRVRLNEPGWADGEVQVWLNGQLVLDQRKLTYRTTRALRIDGLFFSTLFGGGDQSWATPVDQHIDFSAFTVSRHYIATMP